MHYKIHTIYTWNSKKKKKSERNAFIVWHQEKNEPKQKA